jgi:tRNA pseudouridine55 synthase
MHFKLDGALIIDKPNGPTSAKVVANVKQLTGAKKVGHAGTLDPLATGVLVCCLNQSTKLARFLLKGKKAYEAILQLGVKTDTQDASGKVIAEKPVPYFDSDHIRTVLNGFIGPVQQQPPVFSALKHNGKSLYAYARAGHPVYKPSRQVHIYQVKILSIVLPEIRFKVTCSAGTYIRTLCADIGLKLGCGGHLKQLRRIYSSGFSVNNAVTLDRLEELCQTGTLDTQLIPMAGLIKKMPCFVADNRLVLALIQGRPMTVREVPLQKNAPINTLWGNHVQVIDEKKHLIAILTYRKERGRYDYCCVFPNGNAQ